MEYKVRYITFAALIIILRCYALLAADDESSKQTEEFYLRLGNSFLKNGEFEQALSMYSRAMEMNPHLNINRELSDAHRGMGDKLFEADNFSAAVEHYESARKRNPDVDITKELIAGYTHLGRENLNEGFYEAARINLNKALLLAPGSSDIHLLLGEAQMGQADYSGALKEFTVATESSPDNRDAMLKIALLNEKLGNSKKAEELYAAIVEKFPQFIPGYIALGEYYEKKGGLYRAEEVYKKGIGKVPSEPEFHSNLAWIYISQKKYLDAYRECTTAQELEPDNHYVQNYFGLIYMHMNRQKEAREAFEKALALKPDYTGARLNLAFLFGVTGRNEDAINEYKKVLEAEPENAEAHFNIGINYKKQGNYLLAKYHLERAAKIWGHDSTLGKRALQRIGDS